MDVDRRHEHARKMQAADTDLTTLSKRREEASKKIAAADRKYQAYMKQVSA